MRKMERAMRKQKDRCIVADAAGDEESFTAASIKLRRQKDIYEDFCKAADSYTQYERTYVAGYDRRLAGKTGAVTRKQREFEKAQIRLTDQSDSGKIKGQRAVVSNSDGTKHYAHKVGTIDVNDQNAVNKFVSRFEKKYTNADKEHCLVIKPDGTVYMSRGDSMSVNTFELLGEKELKGCFTTHNHPKEYTQYSFSYEDFDFTRATSGKRMRAFDYKYEYEAVFPDKPISQEEMEDVFSEMKSQKYVLFDESGLPEEDFVENAQHIIVENACKKLGITYNSQQLRCCSVVQTGEVGDSMKITTERGVLFTTASGKSILRWNGGKPPTDDGFNKLQVFIDNTVVRHMDPYVTMRTGMLKKSVILGSRMGSGELVFIAPYAHKQYYRNGKLKGKRGSRWFHRMWAAFKDTIVREVKNYARRLMP